MTEQEKLEQLELLLRSSPQRLHAHVSTALANPVIREAIFRDQKKEAEAAATAAAEAAAARKFA